MMIISLDKIGGAHRSKDRRIHEKDATGRGVWNTYLGVEPHMIWRPPNLIELTPFFLKYYIISLILSKINKRIIIVAKWWCFLHYSCKINCLQVCYLLKIYSLKFPVSCFFLPWIYTNFKWFISMFYHFTNY